MFKPEELVLKEVWTVVLSKLSTEDKLSCRPVCSSFKEQVDFILKKNQDRLWLRHRKGKFGHYYCYDKDHRISFRDALYFGRTITVKNLKFVSKLMPSLKILNLDPLDQVYWKVYDDPKYLPLNINVPNYRDERGRAVPITKIFPQVSCLILTGITETNNFVDDLSQVKHLTLFHSVEEGSPTFPNLDSLEIQMFWDYHVFKLPMPSKRFVVPNATIKWNTLPKTLEVIETGLKCDEYISVGKPYFCNLKILKGTYAENSESLINLLKNHKESLTELSFFAHREFANIKVLLPVFKRLQKLSVDIGTDKQAIELKEIKALAHNLQYFELSFDENEWNLSFEDLGAILENLPTGLDNLLIKYVRCYDEISTLIEKIMEKVVNGDTTRVTIVIVDNDDECRKTKAIEYVDEYERNDVFSNIVKMKPEPVRVEKKNTRVFEEDYRHCGRCRIFRFMLDIVISL